MLCTSDAWRSLSPTAMFSHSSDYEKYPLTLTIEINHLVLFVMFHQKFSGTCPAFTKQCTTELLTELFQITIRPDSPFLDPVYRYNIVLILLRSFTVATYD